MAEWIFTKTERRPGFNLCEKCYQEWRLEKENRAAWPSSWIHCHHEEGVPRPQPPCMDCVNYSAVEMWRDKWKWLFCPKCGRKL